MAHGLLCGSGYIVIEPTQYFPACRGDSVDASTSIVGIRLSHDESVALETRDQSSEIRIAGDHPLSDLGAGQSVPSRRAEYAKDIVLRRRETRRGGDRSGAFRGQPCSADQRD